MLVGVGISITNVEKVRRVRCHAPRVRDARILIGGGRAHLDDYTRKKKPTSLSLLRGRTSFKGYRMSFDTAFLRPVHPHST